MDLQPWGLEMRHVCDTRWRPLLISQLWQSRYRYHRHNLRRWSHGSTSPHALHRVPRGRELRIRCRRCFQRRQLQLQRRTAASAWVSHHKALVIVVIAGAVVLLLICCCFGIFRRKRRARTRLAPVPVGSAPPQYSYIPQQETQGQGQGQGQEHYPMMQYQYSPNK
jgi:hypothetical protein